MGKRAGTGAGKMVTRLLPLTLTLLAGCAFSPPFFGAPGPPVEVQVPVAAPVYCAPPSDPPPALPIAALTAASAPADTIRAYAATVIVLKGLVRERDARIAGCAQPADGPAAAPSGAQPPAPRRTSQETVVEYPAS